MPMHGPEEGSDEEQVPVSPATASSAPVEQPDDDFSTIIETADHSAKLASIVAQMLGTAAASPNAQRLAKTLEHSTSSQGILPDSTVFDTVRGDVQQAHNLLGNAARVLFKHGIPFPAAKADKVDEAK